MDDNMDDKKKPKGRVPFLDLREITREPKVCQTHVFIEWDPYGERYKWMELGQASLHHMSDRHDGRWLFASRFVYGVTDESHDSIYAMRIPLIGLEFERCDGHRFNFSGFIDPTINTKDSGGDFRVPPPGYDPRKEPGAVMCNDKGCKGDKPFPHHIVENYLPPFDPELYKIVRGCKLTIIMESGR